MAKLFRTSDGKNYIVPFFLICILFFLWGFAHSLLDILNAHFQVSLDLSKAQSGGVQAAAYGAYFFMAIPAGLIAKRFGYKGGIIAGLSLFAIGAFLFVPAVHINHFWAFLVALLILFCGLTCLETVANPYATILGPAQGAATRINFAQTFNGIGWIGGPLIGSLFIFTNESGQNPFVEFFTVTLQKVFLGVSSAAHDVVHHVAGTAATVAAVTGNDNSSLIKPYVGMGCVVVFVLILFLLTKMPEIKGGGDLGHATDAGDSIQALSQRPLFTRWHFVLAVVAQFLYVAAQTGLGSFFVNYVHEVKALAISKEQAGFLLAFCAMALFAIGRMIGTTLMSRISPGFLLGLFGLINTVLMVVTSFYHDRFGIIALILSYFFMSIMFPSIFALGLFGLGEKTKVASSCLVMTVVGGAICPALMGYIGATNISIGFIVPLICFAFITFYGFVGSKLHH